MRHGNKINHLGRKYGHRRALLANLASALITNKRIITTIAKAKELRRYIEPLITKAKDNSTHSRRVVFSYLQDKLAIQELFDVIAGRIGDRPGGYLRIVRYENRHGDNAEMAFIEFVDFNEVYTTDKKQTQDTKAKRTRRAGSGGAKAKSDDLTIVAAPVAAAIVEDALIVEEPEVAEEIAPIADEIAEVEEAAATEEEQTAEEEAPEEEQGPLAEAAPEESAEEGPVENQEDEEDPKA